jgi:hypothetical protein
MSAPLCIDCKWKEEWRCYAPQNLKNNLVDPAYRNRRWLCCETMRNTGWLLARLFRMCGSDGRWFISKEH